MLFMIITGVALLFFWEQIYAFLLKNVVPWFQQIFGDLGASILKQFLSFVGQAVHWTRQQIRTGWHWFQSKFLGINSEYVRNNANEYVCTTTTYVNNENGQISKIVETEIVDPDSLPSEVRETFIASNPSEPIEVDNKKIIETMFKDQVKKQENLSDEEFLEILV